MNELPTKDYLYDLPQDRIALYPLQKRDEAKLLVYKNSEIQHRVFKELSDALPSDSFLFFNNTKVIPARLHFKKDTGADIEIFLLDPVAPSTVIAEAMAAKEKCIWHCTIGNAKRWNENLILKKRIGDQVILEAKWIDQEKNLINFRWTGVNSFAEIVESAGETPLPPYLRRNAEPSDKTSYQTIYSRNEGAVAAPTAGLHFTENVFNKLKEKNIAHDFLTLHVSAGTFQPIKTEDASQHSMHKEQIVISRKNIENLINEKFFIPVGTTSMRTLESIYWYGMKLIQNPDADFSIGQEDPYTLPNDVPVKKALDAVLKKFKEVKDDILIGETSIYIRPGYKFKISRGLITNFHQPGSTLILLVASLVGQDWKKIYAEALDHQYRFLSYGDSSLLIP